MATMPHPDRELRPLSDVPEYLLKRYGETVTRQTVYNWMKRGKRGVKLRTCKKSPMSRQPYTTWEWVRDFIAKTR